MNIKQIEKFRMSLRLIKRELAEIFKTDAQCCGITLAQCHAMIELGISGSTTISTLASELGLDKSTLSRTIDNLVQQGLVLRNVKDNDRRFMAIELSEKGENFYKSLNERYNIIIRESLEGTPQDKQTQLMDALDLFLTILNNIKQKELLNQIDCCNIQSLDKGKIKC